MVLFSSVSFLFLLSPSAPFPRSRRRERVDIDIVAIEVRSQRAPKHDVREYENAKKYLLDIYTPGNVYE